MIGVGNERSMKVSNEMPNDRLDRKEAVKKRMGVAALAAMLGLLLGATIFVPNLAGAQESTTTTTAGDESTNESTGDRLANRQDRIRTALDGLVANGTITSAQADAVAAELAGQWPERGRRFHRLHFGLDVVSTTIGITEAELREALRGGQTIAEVAEANGVSAQTVIDAIVAAVTTRVDEALAAGNIDEARAAQVKENAVARATEIVNKQWPTRPGDSA